MRNVAGRWLTLGFLAVASLTAACGGSAAPSDSPPAQPGSSTIAEGAAGEPPAASIEPTPTPEPVLDFSEIEPIPPDLPADPDLAVGRGPLRGTAAAIKAALMQAGVLPPDAEVYVLPIASTTESLLVFQFGPISEESSSAEDSSQIFFDIATSPAALAANVTQIVFNYADSDEQGPFVLTIAMSVETLGKLADGTLVEAEIAERLLFSLERSE
jgi:hypothetical protein